MNEDLKNLAKFLSKKIEEAKEDILDRLDQFEETEEEPEEFEDEIENELDNLEETPTTAPKIDATQKNYTGSRKLEPSAAQEEPKKGFSLFGKRGRPPKKEGIQ